MIDKLDYFKDPNFKFDPVAHSYTYINPETGKPVQIFESVSGFISQFKEPFDSFRIAGYVAKSRQTTREIILEEWAATAKEGTDLGTFVHEWIEDYYNGKEPFEPELEFVGALGDHDPMGTWEERKYDRIQKFKQIYEDRLHKLEAKHQELRIFSRKWGIAGTLDVLFWLDPYFYIGDWKTNKKFTDDNHPDGRRKKMLFPFEDLWDNNLNGYSIQISMYRLMLEEVGFETAGGFLVWIGPDAPKLYKTLDLRDRLREFLDKNNFVL
jgi:ATP-dependent exoDNAse (exonuclease V) beta subunit